ncbi:MAG: DUF6258 family protein [Acidobacteria bacterium]|nr:DUF6258 family protein [Acidobacteriota bacterium]
MKNETNISIVEKFLKSIYLGDRACKGYSLHSWMKEFRIQIDEISRIRGLDGQWNYYNDENIVNGSLTFSGVKSVKFDPPGLMPNDYIEILGVQSEAGYLRFRLELGCVGDDALTTAMTVEVVASEVYLESPSLPGVEIR